MHRRGLGGSTSPQPVSPASGLHRGSESHVTAASSELVQHVTAMFEKSMSEAVKSPRRMSSGVWSTSNLSTAQSFVDARTPKSPTSPSDPLALSRSPTSAAFSENLREQQQSLTSHSVECAGAHRQSVRERRAQLQREALEERRRSLSASMTKISAANLRKGMISHQLLTQRHWAWTTVCFLARFMQNSTVVLYELDRRRRLRNAFYPKLLVRARRWLRRARINLARPHVERPQLADIKADRTLNLFSDTHLEYLVSKLELRYYFPNECLIFMSCEENEVFVLASGKVDVLVGPVKVAEIAKCGAVLGSVGMISGEPRTASIVAREPCLVWVCNRATFESFGMTSSRVVEALTIIAELRQANLRMVYKRYSTAQHLSSFAPFRTTPADLLTHMLSQAGPLVLKGGCRIISPLAHMQQRDTMRWFLLLRGTVKFSLVNESLTRRGGTLGDHEDAAAAQYTPSALREMVQKVAQFSTRSKVTFSMEEPVVVAAATASARKKPATAQTHPMLAHLTDTDVQKSYADGHVVATLQGPLLLNVTPLVLSETIPLAVETVTGCDLFVFTRTLLTDLDLVDLDNIRRCCVQMHAEFVPTLPQKLLRETLFDDQGISVKEFSFLKNLDKQRKGARAPPPSQRQEVVYSLETITFDAAHCFDAYIVVRGDVQGYTPSSKPFLWPSLALVYFGCQETQARAETHLDVVRITRKELIDWMVGNLDSLDFECLLQRMTDVLGRDLGKAPEFNFSGLQDDGAEAKRKKSNLSKLSIRRLISGSGLRRTANFAFGHDGTDDMAASRIRSQATLAAYESATEERRVKGGREKHPGVLQPVGLYADRDNPLVDSTFIETSGGGDADNDDRVADNDNARSPSSTDRLSPANSVYEPTFSLAKPTAQDTVQDGEFSSNTRTTLFSQTETDISSMVNATCVDEVQSTLEDTNEGLDPAGPALELLTFSRMGSSTRVPDRLPQPPTTEDSFSGMHYKHPTTTLDPTPPRTARPANLTGVRANMEFELDISCRSLPSTQGLPSPQPPARAPVDSTPPPRAAIVLAGSVKQGTVSRGSVSGSTIVAYQTTLFSPSAISTSGVRAFELNEGLSASFVGGRDAPPSSARWDRTLAAETPFVSVLAKSTVVSSTNSGSKPAPRRGGSLSESLTYSSNSTATMTGSIAVSGQSPATSLPSVSHDTGSRPSTVPNQAQSHVQYMPAQHTKSRFTPSTRSALLAKQRKT